MICPVLRIRSLCSATALSPAHDGETRFRPALREGVRILAVLLLLCIPGSLCPAFIDAALANGARPQQYSPGLRTIGVWRPDLNVRLDVAVWYPSSRAPSAIQLDGWTVAAARDGRIVPGTFPLILLSHGTASTRLADHDLAAALARKGFIVAAPTHPGDNMDDTSFLYRGVLFRDRPRHLLLAMEAVLESPQLGPHADAERIGLLGSGSGSATVLQLAGAVPDFSAIVPYCATAPGMDPYCTPWAATHRETTAQELNELLATEGAAVFTPPMTAFAPLLPISPAASAPRPPLAAVPPATPGQENQPADAPAMDPAVSQPDAPALPEARPAPRVIRSIVVLTPGLVSLFSPTSLAAVGQPVAIVAASNDQFYPVDRNADYLRRNLPRIPAFLTIMGAEHADLHAPCQPGTQPSPETVCTEPDSEKNAMRMERGAFIGQFFLQTLGGPVPPEPLPPAP